MTRRWVLALALAAGAGAGAGCSGGAPSEADCAKIADHMLEVLAAPRAQDKESLQAAETWKKQLQTKDPSRKAILELCARQLKSGHTECLLSAKDEKGLAKCLGG